MIVKLSIDFGHFQVYNILLAKYFTARQTRIKSPYPSKRLFKTSLLMSKGSEKQKIKILPHGK